MIHPDERITSIMRSIAALMVGRTHKWEAQKGVKLTPDERMEILSILSEFKLSRVARQDYLDELELELRNQLSEKGKPRQLPYSDPSVRPGRAGMRLHGGATKQCTDEE